MRVKVRVRVKVRLGLGLGGQAGEKIEIRVEKFLRLTAKKKKVP